MRVILFGHLVVTSLTSSQSQGVNFELNIAMLMVPKEIRKMDSTSNFLLITTSPFLPEQKLPWLLPGAAVAAGCGQYVCFFIDDATQLELSQRWLSIVLNVARVVSLLHVLYGFITFLAVLLFIVYMTGVSMKEFRGKMVHFASFFLSFFLFTFYVAENVS